VTEAVAERRYAASLSRHPVAAHAVGEAAGELLEAFGGDDPDLLVCFVSPHFVGACEDIAHALGGILDPAVMLGMTAVSVIGDALEVEGAPALSMFAAALPDASLVPVSLRADPLDPGGATGAVPRGATGTLLLLADPFSVAVDRLLGDLASSHPDLAVIGGAASAARGPGGNRLLFGGTGPDAAAGPLVRADGAVGVVVDGVPVRTVVSQGCRPLGRPYVITRGHGNRIEELAGRPALERLQECAAAASLDDLELLRQGVHVGLVVDEHRVEFGRGDFLVRNVVGADPDSGTLAVGHRVAVGQTVQFQVRDATAADEDLRELLAGVDASAGLVFTCNGRGQSFFGVPHHDAGTLDRLLGPLPAAGAFCAGEIGSVGGRNFLHSYTASLALFG
jgi:small ligand-binding sensory domain FIST